MVWGEEQDIKIFLHGRLYLSRSPAMLFYPALSHARCVDADDVDAIPYACAALLIGGLVQFYRFTDSWSFTSSLRVCHRLATLLDSTRESDGRNDKPSTITLAARRGLTSCPKWDSNPQHSAV